MIGSFLENLCIIGAKGWKFGKHQTTFRYDEVT